MNVLLAALAFAGCTIPTQPEDESLAQQLTIEPSAMVVAVGHSMELHAVPRDGNGEAVPGYQISWSSSSEGIATISDTGVLRGLSAGKATITAKAEKPSKGNSAQGRETAPGILKKTAEITVEATTVASVDVQPAEAYIEVGGSVDLDAVLKDANGGVLTGRRVEWSLSNSSIASIDADGRVLGLATGSVTVTAASEGRSGSATVAVEDSPPPPPPPPPPSDAAFYVDINDPNASDSNPGTEASPWKTIRKAVETLTAGQTAYVKNGTYTESAGCEWNKPALNPAHSGQPGSPITISAYPGHKPLVTNSRVGQPGCPLMGAYRQSYITISGFEIYTRSAKGAVIYGANHVIFENCEIHGPWTDSSDNTDGIRVEQSSDITLRNLLLYDIHNANRTQNGAAVKLYEATRTLIEHVEAYDTEVGIFNKRSGLDNEFRYNYLHDVGINGIRLGTLTGHTARGLIAHHNIVHNAGDAGIIDHGDSNSPNLDPQIYSNTVVSSGRGIWVEYDASGLADIWNNIVVDGNNNLVASHEWIDECDHNLFFQTPVGCGISGDPLFVGGSGPEAYKLQSGSPAIGTGRNGRNIGAYETGDEAIGRH